MNLVGKIFVVLILVMSMVFASFAVAVYATHKNWMKVVDNPNPAPGEDLGLVQQNEQKDQLLEQRTDQRNALKMRLEEEKSAYEQVRVKLENEKEELRRERDIREKELADTKQAQRELVAAVDAAHKELARLRSEIDSLRSDIRTAHKERDEHFKEVVRLTDQLHASVFELNQLKKTNQELLMGLAEVKNKMRAAGMNPDAEMGLPLVDGVVLAILGDGLVEISLGSDDGLRQDHELYVYRVGGGRNQYIGKVQVLKTSVDRAVCKIIESQGNVVKGDRVASKL